MEPDASMRINAVEMNDMTTGSMNRPLSREQLSALADGELDEAAVGDACAGWYADPSQRAAWHAYHLIGDVMRSDDLASDAAGDADFLASLRDRLASEPVVLAPAPRPVQRPADPIAVSTVAARRRLRSWRAPTAVAAGFVAVAGVLVVMRGADPVPPQRVATSVPAVAQPVVRSVVVPVAAPPQGGRVEVASEPQVLAVNGQLIRDVQLDRYLAAHKQFSGSSALGVPSAFLRSATSDASNR